MPGLGNISTERTVWCCRCEQWHQETSRLKSRFVKEIEAMGWRRIEGKWVCPECIVGKKNGYDYPFKD